MRFITAIIHTVENVTAASDFFCTALGFQTQEKSDNWLLLENGAVSIRLVNDATMVLSQLNLELYSKQLDADSQALLAFAGVSMIAAQVQVSPYRVETRLQAAHGLSITLYQEFNEDDLGILLPLPIALDWEQSAVACVQQLLTYVPLGFRQAARRRVTERAEVLAAEQGEITIILNHAVQALAETTPYFQHPTLVAALQERGIDPLNYFHLPTE